MTQANPRERDDDRHADDHHTTRGKHGQGRDEHGEAHDGTEGAGDDAQVSEGGSGALNQETAEGGADSVPDTPDTSAGDDLA